MRHTGTILTLLGLALVMGFFGWAFYAMRDAGSWTGGSTAIGIMIGVGVIGTGALTAVLMWLAFHSSRHGFDEALHFEPANEDRPRR